MSSLKKEAKALTRSCRSSPARRYRIEVSLLLSSLRLALMIDERLSPLVGTMARLGVVQALSALSSVSSRKLLEFDPMDLPLLDEVCASMRIM